jgi:hypothetical protein
MMSKAVTSATADVTDGDGRKIKRNCVDLFFRQQLYVLCANAEDVSTSQIHSYAAL